MSDKPDNHWTNFSIHFRHVKLDPLFLVGVEREIKVMKSSGNRKMRWIQEKIFFDRDFVVEALLKIISPLYPLTPDKLERLLDDVLEAYSKYHDILVEKKNVED